MNDQELKQTRIYSHRLTWQGWFALLALGLAYWFLLQQLSVILELSEVLLGAFLLALAIRPVADLLQRWRIPRGVTVFVVYGSLFLLVEVLGQLLLPIIRMEMARLREQAPQLVAQTQALQLGGITLGRWLPTTQALVQRVSSEFGGDFTVLATFAIGTAANIGNAMLDFVLLLLVAYFLSLDHTWLEQALLAWTPVQQRERVVRVLVGINQRLTGWVLGQVGRGISFALLLCLGLWLLGVPYAVTLGLIGGLLAIIPYVGGVVATVLGIASALTVSPLLALWTLLLFIGLSVVEEYIISPYLYSQAIGLHPAAVLVVLFAGAKVGGVSGLLFSVPVAVIVVTILSEIQMGFTQATKSDSAG